MILLSLFIAFLSSVSTIINKSLTNTMCNETVILITGLINTLLLIIFALSRKEKIVKDLIADKFTPKVITLFLVMTVGCSLLSTIIYNYLIDLHPPHKISIFISVSPVFTLLLSYYVLNIEVTKKSVLGVFIVLLGVLTIASEKKTT